MTPIPFLKFKTLKTVLFSLFDSKLLYSELFELFRIHSFLTTYITCCSVYLALGMQWTWFLGTWTAGITVYKLAEFLTPSFDVILHNSCTKLCGRESRFLSSSLFTTIWQQETVKNTVNKKRNFCARKLYRKKNLHKKTCQTCMFLVQVDLFEFLDCVSRV